jgi:para-nitrobenzyl esterase
VTQRRTTLQRRELLRRVALGLATAAIARPGWPRAAGAPVVRTSGGRIRGQRAGGVEVFRGVRYGADTGSARFEPPRPATPWSGIHDARDYGPNCPQRGSLGPGSEDCLFLNVWTPSSRDDARRPVMVYVHGGAYSTGAASDPLCDGARLCEHGNVVVVSLNHRLNAFGYLYLARLSNDARYADSGNCGMLDLALALRWIHDNAAAFGGDPARIMLFGQSGGGAKIATLMAMPAAAGLFHRVATMSGQQLTASGPLNATRRARTLLAALALPESRCAELATLPAARIVEALDAIDPLIGRGALYFGPVLDERSLVRHPFHPDAPAQSATIPMIIGNTRDETRSLIGRADPATFALRWDDLPARLEAEMRVDILPERVVSEYRRLHPDYSPSDVFFAATTASRSWRAAIVEAELRAAQGSPTWAYQLDLPSPADGGRWGAFHTLDIPLVFGTLDAPGSLTGTAASARRVSRQLGDAFIALAGHGDPNHGGLPRWEPYAPPRRATMLFDAQSRLVDDPRGAERRLFERVPFIQQGS